MFPQTEGPETVRYWNVSYPADEGYQPGPYTVEVDVSKEFVFYIPISSQRESFNITCKLNNKTIPAGSGE